MELERRESLAAASGRLLTSISVLSIALLTLLPVLFDAGISTLVIPEYGFVFLFTLLSFGFALAAQYRFKNLEVLSPQRLASHVLNEREEFRESEDAANRFAGILEEPYRSIRHLNDRVSVLLRISTILLGIAMFCVVLFGLLDAVLLHTMVLQWPCAR